MFDMILIRYLTLACKTRIEKENVARWKRIEQVREESGFYLFHPKNRKDKPTFRTFVNFDKALNDPTHQLHRRLEKRNKHHIGESDSMVKAKSNIELEKQEQVENTFNYMLELGPQPTDTGDDPYIGNLPSGDSSRSKSHSTINSDSIVGAIISTDNGLNVSHSSRSKSHSTIISDPMFNTTDDLGCSTNLKEKESALTDASVYKESQIISVNSGENKLNYFSLVIHNIDNAKILENYGSLWNCEFSFRCILNGIHPMHRLSSSENRMSSRVGTM
jgi:hypothetical protein